MESDGSDANSFRVALCTTAPERRIGSPEPW